MWTIGLGRGKVGKVNTLETEIGQALLYFLALTGCDVLAGVGSTSVKTYLAWPRGAPR
jgi:hypothetical protein